MPIKPSKLESLFKQFRGDKASEEAAWIDTAILIGQYVDKAKTVAGIKQDFTQGETSPTYTQFEAHGKRTMGSLLYGKLALDNYREGLPEGPEKILCGEVSQILGDLYGSAKENKDKLVPLLGKVNEWLTVHAANSPDKEQAQELTKGLYTMLSCLNIKMGNIPGFVNLVPGASALISTAKTEIPKLMAETEKQAQILEPQAEQIRQERASKERSMEEHFNDRYLEILNKEGESQPTKLATLSSAAAQTTVDIQSLLAKRQEKMQLEENINKLQALLKAANENDNRVRGRKYFHEFVKDNKENYDLLIKVRPEQTKTLETLRETIDQESTLKAGVMKVGSYLVSPFAMVGRLAPEKLRNLASDYASIDTNDSLAKRQLSEMTAAAIVDLKAQLKTKNEEISGLESKLANGNEKLQKQIEEATPEALNQIVTVNAMAVEMVAEYNKVREPIEAMSGKLQEIKQLDKIANDFIRINDNALSKIADWFSRLRTWFKEPSLSSKIEAAKEMKQQLVSQKADYEGQFNEQLKN